MFLPRYMMETEEDKFLSQVVKRELAPYKKILRIRISWRDRLFYCLCFAAFIPAISLLTLFLLSKLKYESTVVGQNQGLVSAPYAIGGIVAALTGILIAILAITAQLNSLYVGGSESLFKKLLSSTNYKPVASLAVGTIVGALIGCMYDGSEPHWILFSSVVVLVFFACATAVTELLVLIAAVEGFGREAARAMFVDELKEENRRALLVELKRRITWNVFNHELKGMGFKWSIWQPELKKGQVKYCLRKIGRFVGDIRLGSLWRLSRKWDLKPISDEESDSGFLVEEPERPTVCVRPGQQLEKRQAVLIVEGENTDPDTQILVESAFICCRRSPLHTKKVPWDDFGDMVRRQIREGNTRELRNILKSFYAIVRDYLDCLEKAEVDHPEPTFPFEVDEYQPPTLGAIGFREIVSNITMVRDRHCLATLVYFVSGIGQVSFGTEQGFEYYRDVLGWLSAFYFSGEGEYELSSEVRTLTVEKFRTGPLYAIRHLIEEERRNERVEKIELVIRYVQTYYTKLCGILSSVWRTGDEQTFYELLDQLNSRIGAASGDAVIHHELAKQTCAHIKKSNAVQGDAAHKADRELEFARTDVQIPGFAILG